MRSSRNGSVRKDINNIAWLAGIALAVYVAMRYILPVVIPFLLGLILALALHPLVVRIQRMTGKSRGMVSILVVFVVAALAVSACLVLGRTAIHQLIALVKNRNVWQESMRGVWCSCIERVGKTTGYEINGAEELFDLCMDKLRTGFQTKTMPYLLRNSIGYIRAVFTVMGMALVTVISGLLILIDYERIADFFHRSRPGRLCLQLRRHARSAGGTYLRAQLIILLAISGICVVGLLLTGNSYALLAGLGIGACDALPFLGTGIVFVPWLLFEVVNGKYWLAVIYGLLYFLTACTRQILEPRLIGERLGYPPILILMSIYIGIHIYGAAGIVLGPVSAFLIYELWRLLVT